MWNSGPMHVNRRYVDTGTHWHRINGGWFAEPAAAVDQVLTDPDTVDSLEDESDGGGQDVSGTEQR